MLLSFLFLFLTPNNRNTKTVNLHTEKGITTLKINQKFSEYEKL